MTWEWLPLVAISLALVIWLLVLWLERQALTHSWQLPEPVRAGSLVAVLAACVGGLITSLGFVDILPGPMVLGAGVAWRSAVLAAAVYALTGSVMARRRRQR